MEKDPEADGWEKTEFPVVCEECLGPNPYVRMMKADYDGECAISGRPFTVFRWKPGAEARYKRTVVCREVALAKNVCQVCLLDLEFGVPVQVRDAVLGGGGAGQQLPQSAANREYVVEQMSRAIERDGHAAVCLPATGGGGGFGGAGASAAAAGTGGAGGAVLATGAPAALVGSGSGGSGGKISAEKASMLRRMSRRGNSRQPYYKRNRPPICTFWMRGACKRADCPYRPCNGDYDMPELKSAPELRTQNMKDRYYGVNDPVANQMLNRAANAKAAAGPKQPPADTSITTLFIGGLPSADDATVSGAVTERDIAAALDIHGEVKSVRVMATKRCAFASFVDRVSAERCMASEDAVHGINVAGHLLNLNWAKPASSKTKPTVAGQQQQQQQQQPRPGMPYPSMDPAAMGSRAPPPAPL